MDERERNGDDFAKLKQELILLKFKNLPEENNIIEFKQKDNGNKNSRGRIANSSSFLQKIRKAQRRKKIREAEARRKVKFTVYRSDIKRGVDD